MNLLIEISRLTVPKIEYSTRRDMHVKLTGKAQKTWIERHQ